MKTSSIALAIALTATLAGCNKPQTVDVGTPDTGTGDVIGTQSFQAPMRTNNTFTDPKHGEEVGLMYGAVEGVGETKANGVGFTHKFADGAFVHTLNVNIQKPTSGTYVVWMSKEESITNPIRVGELQNLLGDVRYSISYDTRQNLSDYFYVFVTRETQPTVANPGTVVAKAVLKAVKK